MTKTPQRPIWPDIIRIIAIYLVVVLHTSFFKLQQNPTHIPNQISFALSKTCIPLFVMLSGALLLGKKETYTTFFSKRLKKLIIPWITWTIIYILLSINPHKLTNIPKTIKVFTTTFQSFWFLSMIASLYILTPAIRIFVQSAKTKDLLYIIILWFLTVSLLPYQHNTLAFPLHVDDGILRQVINYSGYFLLGFTITKIKLPKYTLPLSLSFLIFGQTWIIFNTSLSNNAFDYISPGITISSIAIFTLLYHLGNNRQNKTSPRFKTTLATISSATLGIYFVHSLLQPIIKKIFYLSIYPAVDNFLNGLIIYTASLIIILTLKKIPPLKHLIT